MERLSFVLVPYLPTSKSFTFSNYQFVPLNELSNYTSDAVLEVAYTIAGQYLKQINRPIQTATFVFPIDKQVGEYLNNGTIGTIAEVLKVLYLDGFCHIRPLQIATAENFEAFFYNISPNDFVISTSAGGIFPIIGYGSDVRDISYIMPPYVHLISGYFTPSELMAPALEHVVAKQSPSLIRALTFFFEAMRNDDRRTQLTKTTNLYLAFLMLMKASPDNKERELWWDNMAAISEPGLSKYPYPIIDTKTGKPKTYPKNLNIAQIWGEEFYKLRCKMLHGDPLTADDYFFTDISGNKLVSGSQPHFFLAANVFPALFFYKVEQEDPTFFESPSFVISDHENALSKNFTGLGSNSENYKLPFYINDPT